MNRLYDGVWRTSVLIEAALRWLLAYPLLTAQILLMLLVSWAGLGQELGAERLFWHEDWWLQLGTGFGVGMLYGVILFTVYLAYRPVRLERWLRRVRRVPPGFAALPMSARVAAVRAGRRRLWTLLPSELWEVRLLGRFLLWGLTALLVLTVGVKLFAAARAAGRPDGGSYLEERSYLVPYVAGYLFSLGFSALLFLLDEKVLARSVRERLLGLPLWTPYRGWHALRDRLRERQVRRPHWPLHGIALYLVLVAGVGFLVLLGTAERLDADTERPGRSVTSPVTFVSLVLIVFSLVYGMLAFHLHLQRLLLGLFAGALLVLNSTACFPSVAYKLRFEGLDGRDRTVLWEPGSDKDVEAVLAATREYADRTLIPSEEPLAAMSERWQQAHTGQKPKVVIVCTSGGGIRAAVWTGVVLRELERDPALPRFRDNIRLITGASGGMVGATLYAADFEHNEWGEGHIDALAKDSLTRTAQSLLVRDLMWNTVFVRPGAAAGWDRGRTLQWKWGLNAKAALGRNPFDRTFADLRPLERAGRRPSLVLSPVMVEDARRLLISNLDVAELTTASGPGAGRDRQLTRSAVEFHRLFPDMRRDEFRERFVGPRVGAGAVSAAAARVATSDAFTVGTAARMNATFPVISPAVSLPTAPARRLVDAGIYDNYGVNLAAEWALKNRDALRRHTSGVAVVQVRAVPLHDARNRFAALDPDTGELKATAPRGDLLSDLLSAAAAPVEAVLNARANAAQFRNAELLDELAAALNTGPPGTPPEDQFFCTVWLELHRPAALNWYLTGVEREAIKGAFANDDVTRQVGALRAWYGTGGK